MSTDNMIIIEPTFVRCNGCATNITRRPRITDKDWDGITTEFKKMHEETCGEVAE